MSIRVTQSMLFNNTLFNIQKNSRSLSGIQEMLSSGQKINRPSDDPAGMLRLLPLQSDLRDLEANQSNLSEAKEILNTGAAGLQEASDLLIQARTLGLQAINGTLSVADRNSLGNQIDQLLKQMVSIANTNRAGRFIFGGAMTRTAPFTLDNDSLVNYNGDQTEVTIEIGPGITATINAPGDGIFMAHNRSGTTIDGSTGAASGTGTDSDIGMKTLQVRHTTTTLSGTTNGVTVASTSAASDTMLGTGYTVSIVGGNTVSINGGPTTTFAPGATDVTVAGPSGGEVHLDMSSLGGATATFSLDSGFSLSLDGGVNTYEADPRALPANMAITNSITGKTTYIDPTGINLVGDDLISYSGTFDVFSTLINLRDTMKNTEGLSDPKQIEVLTSMVGELDHCHDSILNSTRDLGSRSEKLDLVRNRISNIEISLTDVMGDIRDIDLADTIMKMTQQETLFQSSLSVGARIMQPSLMNYLR